MKSQLPTENSQPSKRTSLFMGPVSSKFILTAGIAAFLATPELGRAAIYTWANSNIGATPAASLNWFNPTQGTWSGGTPVSGNTNTIQFFADTTTALTNTGPSGNTQTSVIDNGGSAFQLGVLSLKGKASATPGANLTMTISGDALNFSGATGTINLDASKYTSVTQNLTYNLNSNIQLGTATSASVLTLQGAGNGSFNIGGIISELKAGGGSSVVKSGASTVTLSGSNTYSGGTTLSAGTLTAQDLGSNNFLNALGTGTVTLNGGTLNLRANGTGSSGTIVTGDGATGNNVTVGGDVAINSDRVSGSNTGNTYQFTNLSIGANTLTLNSNNSNKLKFAGTTTLTGNANFNLGNTGADLTLVGAIGDGGSGYGITKLGQPSASLILNGANTYTGATTVGSLMYTSSQTVNNTISVSGANGSIATSSGVFVYGRGSRLLLDYTGVAVGSVDRLSDTTTKGVTLGLGGELSFTGNSTAATNTTETMGQLALNNAYGIVTLTKAGTGLVTITASSFSRGSNRATGLIRGTALGTMGNANTAAKLILTDASGVTLVGVTAANNLGTVDTTKNLKIVPYLVAHNTDTGTGNSFLTYDSTLGFRSLSTANEFNTYSAAAAGDNVLVSAAVASAATKTINSLLINAASANLTGAGGGSNTLTINSGAIFFTPSATGNAATISGFDSITLGDGTWNEGVITVGAASDLTSGATNFGTLTISSPIQGGGAGLTKAGRGTLILAAANTFAGATLVNIGTLSVGHNQALQNSAIDTSGYGQIALTVTTPTIGGLTGGTNLASVITTGYGAVTALTLNPGDNVTNTYSGVIANGAAGMTLTKTGNGTQVLSGANSYTGATTVNAGKLVVAGSLNGSTTTTVEAGATLASGLNTTSSVGPVTLHSDATGGGTLAPGDTGGSGTAMTGQLAVNGNLILGTASTVYRAHLAMELGGTTAGTGYDQVAVVGGSVTLNKVDLDITLGGFTPTKASFGNNGKLDITTGDKFFLVIGSNSAITTTFANFTGTDSNLPGFDTAWIGGCEYAISYTANWNSGVGSTFTGGNDIALMAIPEPSTWATLVGGLGMLAFGQRLRRRSM